MLIIVKLVSIYNTENNGQLIDHCGLCSKLFYT